MAYPVEQIANQLLINAANLGELMTNMKLQKMLYYQQGFHLAYFDKPLFLTLTLFNKVFLTH
jgi:uncharacterized phage-associated protein